MEADDQMRNETSGLGVWSRDRGLLLTGTQTVTCLFSSSSGICVGTHQAVACLVKIVFSYAVAMSNGMLMYARVYSNFFISRLFSAFKPAKQQLLYE